MKMRSAAVDWREATSSPSSYVDWRAVVVSSSPPRPSSSAGCGCGGERQRMPAELPPGPSVPRRTALPATCAKSPRPQLVAASEGAAAGEALRALGGRAPTPYTILPELLPLIGDERVFLPRPAPRWVCCRWDHRSWREPDPALDPHFRLDVLAATAEAERQFPSHPGRGILYMMNREIDWPWAFRNALARLRLERGRYAADIAAGVNLGVLECLVNMTRGEPSTAWATIEDCQWLGYSREFCRGPGRNSLNRVESWVGTSGTFAAQHPWVCGEVYCACVAPAGFCARDCDVAAP